MNGCRPWVTKCQTCRKRKVKCDKELPHCQRCLKGGFVCGGYAKEIQFRPSSFNSAGYPAAAPETLASIEVLREPNIKTILRWDKRQKGIEDGEAANSITHQPRFALSPRPGLLSAQHKTRMLDALQLMFVPTVATPAVCAKWIKHGCEQASEEPDSPLSSALLAVSMRKVGYLTGDWNWAVESFAVYQNALHGLRELLRRWPDCCSRDSFLLASFACVMFEVSTTSSFASASRHMRHMATLIECRGIRSGDSTVYRDLVYDFQAFEFPFRLVERRADSQASYKWIWTHNDKEVPGDPLHSVLDYAFIFLPILEKADRMDGDNQTAYPLYEQSAALLAGIEQLKVARVAAPSELANSRQSQGLLAESTNFPDFSTAVAMLYRELLGLHVLSLRQFLRIRTGTEVLHTGTDEEHLQQLYQRLPRICNYCEYFFKEDKKLTGRILFFMSFQVALMALPDPDSTSHCQMAGPEVTLRIRTVCQYLESKGFQPWDECNSRWREFVNLGRQQETT